MARSSPKLPVPMGMQCNSWVWSWFHSTIIFITTPNNLLMKLEQSFWLFSGTGIINCGKGKLLKNQQKTWVSSHQFQGHHRTWQRTEASISPGRQLAVPFLRHIDPDPQRCRGCLNPTDINRTQLPRYLWVSYCQPFISLPHLLGLLLSEWGICSNLSECCLEVRKWSPVESGDRLSFSESLRSLDTTEWW